MILDRGVSVKCKAEKPGSLKSGIPGHASGVSRLLANGAIQRRVVGRDWTPFIALPSLARDIQRKDEALRRIERFPCSLESTGAMHCKSSKCPACIAHEALEGSP